MFVWMFGWCRSPYKSWVHKVKGQAHVCGEDRKPVCGRKWGATVKFVSDTTKAAGNEGEIKPCPKCLKLHPDLPMKLWP